MRCWACTLTTILWLCLVAHCAAQPIEAISQPSRDVTLSFVRAGQVMNIAVREGQQVSSGQVLVQLDDTAEQVRLQQLQAEADNDLRVRAAEAQLDRKNTELERLEQAAKSKAATPLELKNAQLDHLVAKLSLSLARFEHEQARREYMQAKLDIARLHLKSPVNGLVEKVFIDVGESVDELQEVVRVVAINPLWADVPVPLPIARNLQVGDAAGIRYPGSDTTIAAAVIHKAAVADAASNTLTVRVQIPNPAMRPAGEHVMVSFATGNDTEKKDGNKDAKTI